MDELNTKVRRRQAFLHAVAEHVLNMIAHETQLLAAGERPAQGLPNNSWQCRQDVIEALALLPEFDDQPFACGRCQDLGVLVLPDQGGGGAA